jgi:LysM repeat protein
MRISVISLLISLGLASFASGQSMSQNIGSQVAGLREDVRLLMQRVGEMSLRIEQLERENSALMRSTDGLESTYATVAQLNEAVAELNRAISSGDKTSQAQAAKAIQELARQTNAAVDSVAKGMAARPAITEPSFDDNFPKEGFSYTIQRGDTLSSIASRYRSTVRDIQNANRITDPTKIQVGQTLFIPGGE